MPIKRSALKPRTSRVRVKRPGTRRGPAKDPIYLDWIRSLPCLVCSGLSGVMVLARYDHSGGTVISSWTQRGSGDAVQVQMFSTEAAHVGDRGLGQKCSDYETCPLCAEHHRTGSDSHHAIGKAFWKYHGLNKEEVLKQLHAAFCLTREALQ